MRAGSRAPTSSPAIRRCHRRARSPRASSMAGSTPRRGHRSTSDPMCLLVLAWRTHPRFRLVVAANRDEYHERPAAALAPWADNGGIIGGRDLQANGTWLAVDT